MREMAVILVVLVPLLATAPCLAADEDPPGVLKPLPPARHRDLEALRHREAMAKAREHFRRKRETERLGVPRLIFDLRLPVAYRPIQQHPEVWVGSEVAVGFPVARGKVRLPFLNPGGAGGEPWSRGYDVWARSNAREPEKHADRFAVWDVCLAANLFLYAGENTHFDWWSFSLNNLGYGLRLGAEAGLRFGDFSARIFAGTVASYVSFNRVYANRNIPQTLYIRYRSLGGGPSVMVKFSYRFSYNVTVGLYTGFDTFVVDPHTGTHGVYVGTANPLVVTKTTWCSWVGGLYLRLGW